MCSNFSKKKSENVHKFHSPFELKQKQTQNKNQRLQSLTPPKIFIFKMHENVIYRSILKV